MAIGIFMFFVATTGLFTGSLAYMLLTRGDAPGQL